MFKRRCRVNTARTTSTNALTSMMINFWPSYIKSCSVFICSANVIVNIARTFHRSRKTNKSWKRCKGKPWNWSDNKHRKCWNICEVNWVWAKQWKNKEKVGWDGINYRNLLTFMLVSSNNRWVVECLPLRVRVQPPEPKLSVAYNYTKRTNVTGGWLLMYTQYVVGKKQAWNLKDSIIVLIGSICKCQRLSFTPDNRTRDMTTHDCASTL